MPPSAPLPSPGIDGEEVTAALSQAMHSANWHVRYNAARSLSARGFRYEDLQGKAGGTDRYAREMLTYRLETMRQADATRPLLPEQQGKEARSMSVRDFIQLFLWCVECFFVLYMVGYASFLFVSVAVGSSELYAAKRRNLLQNELDEDYYLPVSIIVPAHNEGVTVESTVRSLLTLDYKLYEIIVVDDGSTDDTADVVREAFHMWKVNRPIQRRVPCQPELEIFETQGYKVPITLVRKKNGGKADALNMGINVSNFPYFLCIDADTVLQYDSLRRNRPPDPRRSPDVWRWAARSVPATGLRLSTGRVIRYRMPKEAGCLHAGAGIRPLLPRFPDPL